MSKRYGRNQKRKAREQHQIDQREISRLNNRLNNRHCDLDRARLIVETVTKINPNFIGLEPRMVEMSSLTYQRHDYDASMMFMPMDENSQAQDRYLNILTVDLLLLKTEIINNLDQVHFMASLSGNYDSPHRAGYAISRKSVKFADKDLIKNISRELSHHLGASCTQP